MKQKFGRTNVKIFIFIISSLVTISWLLFYTISYNPVTPLYLFFTYQSNVIVLFYYGFWVGSFLIFLFASKRKPLQVMDNYRWAIVIGSMISLTSFIGLFILGPFESIYALLKPGYSDQFDISTGQHIFMGFNAFMMHFTIPFLVIYDLWTDHYDEDKIKKDSVFYGLIYLVLYLIAIEINGSYHHIYPYIPLDPSSFEGGLGLLLAIISPFVGLGIYIFIDSVWFQHVNEQNGGYLFNAKRKSN